jgi:hypothetical protein
VPVGVSRGSSKPAQTSGALNLVLNVLYSHKEKLISEAKGQVLQERWMGVSAQPGRDSAIDLFAQVDTGRLPAWKKALRQLVHLNFVHSRVLPVVFMVEL